METPTPADMSTVDNAEVEWLYTQRGETFGPVSSADLRAAAHLGFLGPSDMVCRKDRGKWVTARSVRGLFKEAG